MMVTAIWDNRKVVGNSEIYIETLHMVSAKHMASSTKDEHLGIIDWVLLCVSLEREFQ